MQWSIKDKPSFKLTGRFITCLFCFILGIQGLFSQVNNFQWWNMSPVMFNPAQAGNVPSRFFVRKIRAEIGYQSSQGSLVRYPYLSFDKFSKSGFGYGLNYSSERLYGRMMFLSQLNAQASYILLLNKELSFRFGTELSLTNKSIDKQIVQTYVKEDDENEILLHRYLDTGTLSNINKSQQALLSGFGTLVSFKKNDIGFAIKNIKLMDFNSGKFLYPSRINFNISSDLEPFFKKDIHFKLYLSGLAKQNSIQTGFHYKKKNLIYSLFFQHESGPLRKISSVNPGIAVKLLGMKASYSPSFILQGRGFIQHNFSLRAYLPYTVSIRGNWRKLNHYEEF